MVAAQTLAQKLLAAASGKTSVAPGEIVTCDVDLAMFHDSSGPRRLQPMLEDLGATIWDKSKVVLVIDHYVPELDDESRGIVKLARQWASSQALPHVYDSVGICHVILPERGHLRPGMLCVGGDSHSPTGGAFGTYMFGIGSTEMLSVLVSGKIWIQVPETIMMRWNGALQKGVTAKDMMLHMIGRFGMSGARYQAIEFCGNTITGLPMQERMTLSNMSAELGAQVGLIAPDAITQSYLRTVGVDIPDVSMWRSDDHANAEIHDFDAETLTPQVAAPHSPANTRPVGDYLDTSLSVAYIGACTGAKLSDLRAAAQVLKGHKVSPDMRLIVAPASAQDQTLAHQEGIMEILMDAGAELRSNSCGACAGYGGTFNAEDRVISTTARNFKGRMGSPEAQIYLASPYTVAASALRGYITDPREVL